MLLLRFAVNDKTTGRRSAHCSGTVTPRLQHDNAMYMQNGRYSEAQLERLAALLELIRRRNKAEEVTT